MLKKQIIYLVVLNIIELMHSIFIFSSILYKDVQLNQQAIEYDVDS